MRPLILATFLALTGSNLAAQTIPPMPTLTFPEAGTFCGVLTLCPKADVAKGR